MNYVTASLWFFGFAAVLVAYLEWDWRKSERIRKQNPLRYQPYMSPPPPPPLPLSSTLKVNPVTFNPFEVAELERDPDTLRKVADINDEWESDRTSWGMLTTARGQELRLEAMRRAGL